MTLERNQVISALVTASTALFLLSVAPGLRYRRQMRMVAVAGYVLVLAGVLAWVALWLAGVPL